MQERCTYTEKKIHGNRTMASIVFLFTGGVHGVVNCVVLWRRDDGDNRVLMTVFFVGNQGNQNDYNCAMIVVTVV